MNRKPVFALAATLMFACAAPTFAGQSVENFTAPASADGTVPGWVLAPGFSVSQGALATDGSPARVISAWTAAPVGDTITYTANVTPTDVPGTSWNVVGIGVMTDAKNYWHLALVQAPDDMKKGHFAELSQMYAGTWGAQGQPATKLDVTTAAGGFEWKAGTTYQFKITLTPTQIQGQIFDAGVAKYDRTFKFTAPAVKSGRPMVDQAGIKAKFTNLQATIASSTP
jgi:hypothetical protein